MQELGPDKHWVSECLFGIMFALFVLWTFSPFVTQHKRFYTVVMWSRILMVLVGESHTHTHTHQNSWHLCFSIAPLKCIKRTSALVFTTLHAYTHELCPVWGHHTGKVQL